MICSSVMLLCFTWYFQSRIAPLALVCQPHLSQWPKQTLDLKRTSCLALCLQPSAEADLAKLLSSQRRGCGYRCIVGPYLCGVYTFSLHLTVASAGDQTSSDRHECR